MKSYDNFVKELEELVIFRKSTLYAFNETESLLNYWTRNRLKFNELSHFDHQVSTPEFYSTKRSNALYRRKSLNEIVFVRIISALEVFLVDLIRDAFIITKEPFKKQDIIFQFSQAEILSINSPANFYNKVINRECRRLSSSGFNEIVKYYRKVFQIDLFGFTPGINKMEEYHDRRHLLVHRLGRTDIQFRERYHTSKLGVSVDDDYLQECIDELFSFSDMVNNQIIYQLRNNFINEVSKIKTIERQVKLMVVFPEEIVDLKYFHHDYEFWSQDEFSVFADILDDKHNIDERTQEYNISGSFAQIRSFTRIVRRAQKKEKFSVVIVQEKVISSGRLISRILDSELLKQIEEKLPPQPWETGIHKFIATELDVSNKLVSIAIQQLITKGVFKPQIDGNIIKE